jgi:hypothetical protein
MDRIVSESIAPDGNSDEELDELRKILKGTEDGRQKEEPPLLYFPYQKIRIHAGFYN